jgi:hypothetical protein
MDIVNDAIIMVKGLKETLAQKNAVIALKNTTIKHL